MREIKLIEALKLIKQHESIEVKSLEPTTGAWYTDIISTEQIKLDTHGDIYDFKSGWTVIELDYVGKIMTDSNKIYFMERHSKNAYLYSMSISKGDN